MGSAARPLRHRYGDGTVACSRNGPEADAIGSTLGRAHVQSPFGLSFSHLIHSMMELKNV